MKAKAAVSDGNGSFSIEEIDVGDPGKGEVLVQIKASGVCHTDYDSMRWGRPLVMGHEGAGIVLKVGSNIRSVAPVIMYCSTGLCLADIVFSVRTGTGVFVRIILL